MYTVPKQLYDDCETFESFYIQQGVREGEIFISTDVYEVYLNPSLNRLSPS